MVSTTWRRSGWAAAVLVCGLTGLCCAGDAAAPAAPQDPAAVSRDEFEALAQKFQQFETENAKLKAECAKILTENEQIRADNQQLKQDNEGLRKIGQPSESKLDDVLDKDAPEPGTPVQPATKGTEKFLLAGYAIGGFQDLPHAPPTFTSSFHPLFAWKVDEHIFFESRMLFANGGINGYLQVANLDVNYIVNDNLVMTAGRFPAPFGYFARNLREGWSNKLPDAPLQESGTAGCPLLEPYDSDGVMASGGFHGGPVQFNYGLAVVNGPTLYTAGPNEGLLFFGDRVDTKENKDVEGRLGVLPLASLEFGFSFERGRVGPAGTPQHNAAALLLAADASYTHTFQHLKGTVDLRFEWTQSDVDNETYGTTVLDDNRRAGYYAQFAYRPLLAENNWLSHLEGVARFDETRQPHLPGALGGTPGHYFGPGVSQRRVALGLDYWLNSSSVLKFAYEDATKDGRSFWLQFVAGF